MLRQEKEINRRKKKKQKKEDKRKFARVIQPLGLQLIRKEPQQKGNGFQLALVYKTPIETNKRKREKKS